MKILVMSEGINNDPQSPKDFLNRMAPIVNQRGDWRADGIYYATDAVTVGVNEGLRVQTAADKFKAYSGLETHAMGHSNGTRVILDGWIAAARPPLASVHLLCGACDADCDFNGLNAGLDQGLIGDAFIYVASEDEAMVAEDTMPGAILFGLPFGHKPLGLAGPKNVRPSILSSGRLHVISWTGYGHSTCWDDAHFMSTVLQVMSLAERPRAPIIRPAIQAAVQTQPAPHDLSPRAMGEQIQHL